MLSMRQSGAWTFMFLFLFLFQRIKGQDDSEYDDVTLTPAFGCRWYGGNGATLECQCREDAQVNISFFFAKTHSLSM